MKILFHFLLATIVIAAGCTSNPKKAENEEKKPDSPAVSYWKDSSARHGLYVADDSTGAAAMYLNGEKFYATGTNCYELFLGTLKQKDGRGGIDLRSAFEALNTLKRNGVGVVRFNCGVYFASELPEYIQNRAHYLSALRQLAAYAEQLKIGLIPSFFWHFSAVPEYYKEPYRSWGRANSRTIGFMRMYATDVVTALRPYKSIFAWEFGNEFNLQADLPNWQKEFGQTNAGYWVQGRDVNHACRLFAETVRSLDPDGRMILSGHSTMRPEQYHLNTEYTFKTDNTEQYRTITELFNPDPVNGITEHVYQAGREFSDRGRVSLGEQIAVAMNTARALDKVYVVGEFGGILPLKQAYRTYYEAFLNQGVQLSLIWNFSPTKKTEYSFTAEDELGKYIFYLIREYNAKYRQKYPDRISVDTAKDKSE